MDSERGKPQSIEPLRSQEKLDAETTALIGDFVLSILRAEHVFASLIAEVPAFAPPRQGDHTLYAALLIAICAGQARKHPLNLRQASKETGMDHSVTLPRFVKLAVDAGHVTRSDHPTDKRIVLLRPSERTMRTFEQEMPAIARIASKLKEFTDADVAKLREATSALSSPPKNS